MKKPKEPIKPTRPELKQKTKLVAVEILKSPTKGNSLSALAKKYPGSEYVVNLVNYGRQRPSHVNISKQITEKPTARQLEKHRKAVEKYNLEMDKYFKDLEQYKKDISKYLDDQLNNID